MYNKLGTVVSRYLKLPIEYLGAIPQDSNLENAVMQQMPVSLAHPGAKSSKAFEELSIKLAGDNYNNGNDIKRGMTGFFANFISRRR